MIPVSIALNSRILNNELKEKNARLMQEANDLIVWHLLLKMYNES